MSIRSRGIVVVSVAAAFFISRELLAGLNPQLFVKICFSAGIIAILLLMIGRVYSGVLERKRQYSAMSSTDRLLVDLKNGGFFATIGRFCKGFFYTVLTVLLLLSIVRIFL